jgi:amino acid transporter
MGTTLSLLLIINMYFSGQGSFTVTTRIAYAMARDGAFPCSNYIKTISSHTKAPTGSIAFTCLVDVILILLTLVNTTAFGAVTSLSVIGYQISYAIPIYLRITASRNTFTLSDFNLGGWSICIGTISFTWLLFTSLLFFFPTVFPVTASNMNYTSVIVAFVALIGGLYWKFSKHILLIRHVHVMQT